MRIISSKNLVILLIFGCNFISFVASEEEKKVENVQQENGEFSSSLSLLKEHGALLGSMLSIIVSEIGDKTFIITAVLSAKYNKFWVFLGSYGALFLMTFISCFIGNMSEYLLPEFYIKLFSALLFFIFGVKSIYEAATNQVEDEDEEIENELKALEEKLNHRGDNEEVKKQEVKKIKGDEDTITQRQSVQNKEKKETSTTKKQSMVKVSNLTIATLTFAQNFLGEWGDKSQLSTIAMGASFNFYRVFIGAALGHFCCSLLAITGGKLLAEKLSERTLTLLGGILFVTYGIGTVASVY